MEKVTIGICCYKQKKWLYRCLRSLASQKSINFNDIEVIVVNDEAGTEKEIDEIADRLRDILNVKIIHNGTNIGLPASLNKLLKQARGRYFVRVDADDYVSEHFIYYLTTFLELNRNYQAVACDYKKVNNVGNIIENHVDAKKNPIACGIMFTYESLCEAGLYNEEFKMREGHELLNRFNKTFSIFNLPVPLYRYRIHNENRSLTDTSVGLYDKKLENLTKDKEENNV